MKQIKRIAAIALAVVMLFSLASCSLVNSSETDITNDNIKIGVILKDTGDTATGTTGICNATINSVTGLGFGISSERFKVVENVDPSDKDAIESAYKSLVNFECNIIIASDPAYYDNTLAVADNNPSVAFLVFGVDKGNGKNVFAYNANLNESVYLEGIAAGLKAAELKMPDIGYIKAAEDSALEASFTAGVKSANPAAKVTSVVANDIAADAKALISGGCAVLASDVQNEEIAKAAAENDVFFCDFGTTAFNNEDYGKAFLCAPLYDFTQYYVDTIKKVIDYELPDNSQKGAVELLISEGQLTDYAGDFASGSTYLSEVSLANGAQGTAEAIRAALATNSFGVTTNTAA